MKQNIYKNKEKGKVDGVCYGLGKSIGVSPNIFRIFFVLFTFILLIGLMLYLYLSFVMIDESNNENKESKIFYDLRTKNWAIMAPVIFTILFVAIMIITGSILKMNIPGEYKARMSGETVGTFIIRENGSFSYNAKIMGGISRKGRWEKIDENTIILHYSDGGSKTIEIDRDRGAFTIGSTYYHK